MWFVIDAFTHLSIELGYVLVALGPTARRSDSLMGACEWIGRRNGWMR